MHPSNSTAEYHGRERSWFLSALMALVLGLACASPLTAQTVVAITGPQDPHLVLTGNFVVAEYYGLDEGLLPIGGVVFHQNNARLGTANTTTANLPNFGATQDATNFALISYSDQWIGTGFNFSIPTVAGRSYVLQLIFHDNFFATNNARQFNVSAGLQSAGLQLLAQNLDLVSMGAWETNPVDVLITLNVTNSDGTPLQVQIAPGLYNNPQISALTLQDVSPAPVPPYVSIPPTSKTLFAGRTLVLSATVAGSTPLTYQWQSGTTGSGIYTNLTDVGNVSGSATTTLTITNITAAQGADYQLVASNAGGSASNVPPATVTVLPATVITAGTNYAYAIMTNTPADYWRLNENNGSPLVYDNGPGGHDGNAGANLTLGAVGPQSPTFPGLEAANTGIQTANGTLNDYVTVPALNLNTNTVTMLAWVNPNANQLQGTGIMLSRSGNVSNFCSGLSYDTQLYPSGDYTLNYIWNGDLWQLPASDSGLQVPQGIWSLVALAVSPTNATIYVINTNGLASFTRVATHTNCPFSNPFLIGNDTFDNAGHRTFNGSIDEVAVFSHTLTSSQILALYSKASGITTLPPTASSPSALTVVAPGTKVTLTANVSGNPTPTCQWQMRPLGGSSYVNLTDGPNISGSQTNTLTITNVGLASVGDYVLVVHNNVGTATSTKARVLMIQQSAPTLIGQWVSGTEDYADHSGFNAVGQHDAVVIGTASPSFALGDVPPGYSGSLSSLTLGGGCALAVTNTSQNDSDYRLTFDHNITNKFSIAFWAKGYPSPGWSPFVSKNGESVGWQLRDSGTKPANNPTLSLRGTAGNADAADGAPLNISAVDGAWHHYAGTYDSATGIRHLYVDGVQEINLYSDFNGWAPASLYHLVMGGRENPALQNIFPGSLFDVRVYNYALSAGEVQALVTPPPAGAVSVFLSATNGIPLGQSEAFTVCIPEGANQSSPVTVLVTNLTPTVGAIEGATNNVFKVTFAAGAPSCQYFTIDTIGIGQIQLAAGDAASVLPSDTSVPAASVVSPALIGQWIAGTADLTDKSGFTAPGTHDGRATTASSIGGGTAVFTNDVPAGFSGQSLLLNGTYTVTIANSSTLDGGYQTTFDDQIAEAFSVSFWAKGTSFPSFQPWVGKRGESSFGWKVRAHGTDNVPTFTMRMTGDYNNDDPFGSPTLLTGLGAGWHHCTATWDGVAGVRKLYVDGKLSVTEVNDNGPIGLAKVNFLTIGGIDNNDNTLVPVFGNFLTGEMYDVRMYNYALSASDVLNVLTPNTTALVAAADAGIIDQGHTGAVSLSLPSGANATSPVTVFVTNVNPSVVSISGAPGNVYSITFPAGAYPSKKLTLTGLGQGQAQIAFGASGFTSTSATVQVYGPQLVGRWVAGSQNLVEVSGFRPAGTHDGFPVTNTTASTHLAFSTDVPAGFPGRSLALDGTYAIRITNSCATASPGYAPTFDDVIANNFTIAFWTKAAQPTANWTAWVSKRGDDAIGFQVRRNGSANNESFTLRQTALHGFEDNAGTTGLVYNSVWHHIAAVYDGYSGTRKLYLDGVLEPTINFTGDFGPYDMARNHHLVLGSEDSNAITTPAVGANGYLNGKLYDVRVYNYPLSVTQVQGLLTPTPVILTVQAGLGGTVKVSWPAAAIGYVLQTSASLTGGWTNSSLTVTTAGGQNSVDDTIGVGPKYYRLYLP